MKTACFIPIKADSERVPGKNLRILNGKKLYQYICEHIVEANVFDDVFIDTNSEEVMRYAKEMNFKIIRRKEELARDTANGNDLLIHHYTLFPDYDYYFQLFVTAPYLQPESIRKCYEILIENNDYDSCFTATENHGFYWFNNVPVNYRPCILPRSQDMTAVIEETTGLYGITADSLAKYRCRIGKNPYIHTVSKFEAVDINTEDDLKIAEYVGKIYWKYQIGEFG